MTNFIVLYFALFRSKSIVVSVCREVPLNESPMPAPPFSMSPKPPDWTKIAIKSLDLSVRLAHGLGLVAPETDFGAHFKDHISSIAKFTASKDTVVFM